MSISPAINPVALAEAITPQPQANMAKQSDGKDFAKALNKASKQEADDAPVRKTAEGDADNEKVEASSEPASDTAGAAVEAAVEAAVVAANLTANNAITEIAVPIVPVVAVPVAGETTLVAPGAEAIEGITALAPATPVVTSEVLATSPTLAVAIAAPVAVPVEGEVAPATATETPIATATPALLEGELPTSAVAIPVEGEVPAELVTELAGDGILDSLSKKVDVATATGTLPENNATPVSTSENARSVLEALGSKNQNATPLATAPATTGAQVADIPTPVRQLVHLVAPLRNNGDGDYKLLLQLHPEHLGRVEVAVSLNQGQISMQLAADNPNSRQMLRESMNELRQSLTDAGLDAGSLDVGQHNTREQTNNAQSGGNGQIPGGVTDADEEQFLSRLAPSVDAATQNKMATDGPLDVHV